MNEFVGIETDMHTVMIHYHFNDTWIYKQRLRRTNIIERKGDREREGGREKHRDREEGEIYGERERVIERVQLCCKSNENRSRNSHNFTLREYFLWVTNTSTWI